MKFGPYLPRLAGSGVWSLRILKFIDIYVYSLIHPINLSLSCWLSAPDALSLGMMIRYYYSLLYYTRVAPDTTDFPAYSQILLKQCVCFYFNTVIVTADVHWCFGRSAFTIARKHRQLWHSSTGQASAPIHPLASLAGTCVFGKQSLGDTFVATPVLSNKGSPYR